MTSALTHVKSVLTSYGTVTCKIRHVSYEGARGAPTQRDTRTHTHRKSTTSSYVPGTTVQVQVQIHIHIHTRPTRFLGLVSLGPIHSIHSVLDTQTDRQTRTDRQKQIIASTIIIMGNT